MLVFIISLLVYSHFHYGVVSFSRSMYNECRANCFLEQSNKSSHVFPTLVNNYIDVCLGEGGVGCSGLGVVSGNGEVRSNLG
jgi:hypothetical protein